MGLLVGILAVTGPEMATGGWQAYLSGDLQRWAHVATTWLGHLPGFLSALGVLAALATVAVRQVADRPDADLPAGPAGPADHAPPRALARHPARPVPNQPWALLPRRCRETPECRSAAQSWPELARREGS
jgi:hypothetical protein